MAPLPPPPARGEEESLGPISISQIERESWVIKTQQVEGIKTPFRLGGIKEPADTLPDTYLETY